MNQNIIGRNYVAGDTHGKNDIQKIYKWYSKNQHNITTFDNLFILGDWGGIWFDKSQSRQYKKDVEYQIKFAKKKFNTFIIPGNHENYIEIKKLPIIEKFGGKVRVLTPINPYNKKTYGDIYLLERGEIYTINNQKILALGGAKSQDISQRILNIDYWEDELWNIKEEYNCLDNLEKHNWEVDYVFAHTCPTFVGQKLMQKKFISLGDKRYYSFTNKSKDSVASFFEHLVNEGLKFKEWHFGHYHEDILIDDFKDIDGNYIYQCHYLKPPKEIK
jgi:hypothetical protein